MITILLDHNIAGQAVILWGTLVSEGWLDVLPIRLVTLADVNLPENTSDRVVWQFAQQHKMILLTDNRNMKGKDSLELTIREENTPSSFPVLTIGTTDRLDEKTYREQVVTRLVDIAINLDDYLGTGRIFIP